MVDVVDINELRAQARERHKWKVATKWRSENVTDFPIIPRSPVSREASILEAWLGGESARQTYHDAKAKALSNFCTNYIDHTGGDLESLRDILLVELKITEAAMELAKGK